MPTSEQPVERPVRTISRRHVRKGHGAAFYVLAVITAVLVLNVLFGERGLLAMMRERQNYRKMEEDLALVRAENARLREQERRVREDPATIEDLARRELGLIRPGEKVFIIRDVPPAERK